VRAAPAPPSVNHADPRDASGDFDLRGARLWEHTGVVTLSIATWGAWTNAELGGLEERRLCLLTYKPGVAHPRAQFCVVSQPGSALPVLRAIRYGPHGAPPGGERVPAQIARRDPHLLVVSFPSYLLGPSGLFDWAVVTTALPSGECGGPVADPTACLDELPGTDRISGSTAPRLAGCKASGPSFVLSGARAERRVALTFDDGPSPYTQRILSILRDEGVHATFFLIGQQVRPYAERVRQELEEGHMVGNHTWSHANVSGGGGFARSQIERTQGAIHEVSGFTPCLFRAPGGAVGGGLFGVARALGTLTIQWDVDPQDWRTPGAGAIYSRVVGAARPGSIVLMHDGGGYRGQTVAALPEIIHTLRDRGYRFTTVDRLLGLSVVHG
jgi:peptidoglycan/xylan/chitin deacetylase (PgdA/CDA1 family)